MTAISTTGNVADLVRRAEQLPLPEFEAFLSNILTINAKRRASSLSEEESVLLKNINRSFPKVKMERFAVLDEKRRQETLTPDEHRELLRLVRQLEKYDAERIQWLGQLAVLRKVPLVQLMTQLGFLPKKND